MKNECAQPFLSHVPSFSGQGKPASGAICSPKLIVTLLLATLLSGCVLSFYPLFDSGQALYDPALVGVWKAINADPGKPEKTKMIFTVTRLSDRNSYWLETEMDHQPKGLYYAEIGLVGTNRFLQIAPRRPPDIPVGSIYGEHFIQAWSFWKMRLDGDKLELAEMNYQWLEAMVKAGKVDIKHEQQDRRFIVLTASTRDLQSFVAKYANEAFGEGIEFDRQKAAQPGGAAPAPSRPLTPVPSVQTAGPGVGHQASGAFFTTASMLTARRLQTATLLRNGKVLVVGGFGEHGALSNAELYDPVAKSWAAAASLTPRRWGHTATLLNNGKVLVVGGTTNDKVSLADAQLYNPDTGTWESVGPLKTARNSHTATLLSDGRVLVVGGRSGPVVSAEIYDPASGAWNETSSPHNARSEHAAVLLRNGMVLIAGGNGRENNVYSAELYNPATGKWKSTGGMNSVSTAQTAILLPNGNVLLGSDLYDAASGIWTPVHAGQRIGGTCTLLPSGKVLMVGGYDNGYGTSVAKLYDPATDVFTPDASTKTSRAWHTATLLPDGKVLIAGGIDFGQLSSVELYDPGK